MKNKNTKNYDITLLYIDCWILAKDDNNPELTLCHSHAFGNRMYLNFFSKEEAEGFADSSHKVLPATLIIRQK